MGKLEVCQLNYRAGKISVECLRKALKAFEIVGQASYNFRCSIDNDNSGVKGLG